MITILAYFKQTPWCTAEKADEVIAKKQGSDYLYFLHLR